MRARIFGLLGIAFIGAAPAGALGAGLLTDAVGLRATLITGGVLYFLLALVPLFRPQWRDLDNFRPAD